MVLKNVVNHPPMCFHTSSRAVRVDLPAPYLNILTCTDTFLIGLGPLSCRAVQYG